MLGVFARASGDVGNEFVGLLVAVVHGAKFVARHYKKVITVEPVCDEEIRCVTLGLAEREMDAILIAAAGDEVVACLDSDFDLAFERVVRVVKNDEVAACLCAILEDAPLRATQEANRELQQYGALSNNLEEAFCNYPR